jgi:hypothetical protein
MPEPIATRHHAERFLSAEQTAEICLKVGFI